MKQTRKLHVVQGDKVDDKRVLERRAGTGFATPSWILPKSAAPRDDVVVYIGGYGFFATGKVNAEPQRRDDWKNRYGASLARVRLIKPPISLAAIRRHIPKLTWANYPRSITTPTPEVAAQIRALIRNRRRTGLPDLDDESLNRANLDELRKAALLGSRSTVSSKRRTVIARIRSQAIRLYVLRRAKGDCEGFGNRGPFRTAEGTFYLEPHHTHRLADGGPDHPARVIALCPNCHRRAHPSIDAKVFNKSLIRRLRILERR
jgi:5-methylcytosine-specific restriction endonuclease McrA